ncbi:MAG: (d)CMP kinase, partial [Dermatophilaceae bacterium]
MPDTQPAHPTGPRGADAASLTSPTSPTAPTGFVVAIDGPSGSGKSSVSKQVARELGFRFLDTGAMYRALTWWCLQDGIDLADEDAVATAADDFPLHIGTDPDHPTVSVAGHDVARAIRETRISTRVSLVATNLRVRESLRLLQRSL